MLNYEKVVSRKNLELAWRRITTGTNMQYKRFFRPLYFAYEVGLKKNLDDFHDRLEGGSYECRKPERVYLPKLSGFQRPISLLCIEDQIVLQAIANEFARKHRARRKELELKNVFSNVLNPSAKDIFFLRDWHQTYRMFLNQIEKHYNQGLRWIADFDLAAFYNTISHDLLLHTGFSSTVAPEPDTRIADLFKRWSAERSSDQKEHGIPQGPLASDFLAECFLIPIDRDLSRGHRYVRFVDDIRIFGRTEMEVREATMELELLCHQRGLIPQGSKHAIKEAQSLEEAKGLLPSIGDDDSVEKDFVMTDSEAIHLFNSSLSGRPKRITDKSRARYVLYKAKPSHRLRKIVMKLLPLHPEHVDAFVHHLSQYRRYTSTVRACREVFMSSPYQYVQGEMLHLLARLMTRNEMRPMLNRAVKAAKNMRATVGLKWGALNLLCRAEVMGLGRYSQLVKLQDSSLVQGLVVPLLPEPCYDNVALIIHLLKRSSPEPGLMLAEQLVKREIPLRKYGVRRNQLPSQVRNAFVAVGLLKAGQDQIDPMEEILKRRYGIHEWHKWSTLFGARYVHALQILSTADPVFNSGRSRWFQYQNSFNHALLLALQDMLNARGLPGAARTVGRDGGMVPFGVLVDQNGPFRRAYTLIADVLRQMNSRRNSLPGSHPYETNNGTETRHLTQHEQRNFHQGLTRVYQDVITRFDQYI